MKFILTILLLIGITFNAKTQTDTIKSISKTDTTLTDISVSSYGNIPTKKFYKVSSEYDGKGEYKINGDVVSKKVYEKYLSTWKNMENCKPCILESYDVNNKLISTGIQYTDCIVGFWIEYYSSGQTKLIGHYKENLTGNWNNIFNRRLCCVKDGSFVYFKEEGLRDYVEVWKDGVLITTIKY